MGLEQIALVAAEKALPMVGNFLAGKAAEQIGSKNEGESAKQRLLSRFQNENPNEQGNRQAESTNSASGSQQNRSRNDIIFDNQLKQSSNRADLQNQMTANDQEIAYRRGQQLADNYVTSAANQATSSGNILNSIMNAPVARYGSNFGR
jgi:hypothetical protein